MHSSLSALHVLHWLLIRMCWQMLPPPHSLHLLLCRLCTHCPVFAPLARFPPLLPPPSSPSGAARLLLPSPLSSSAALLPPEPPESPNHPSLRPPRLLFLPLPMRALAWHSSARSLPLPPPPTEPAPAVVPAPSLSASATTSVPAGSLPLPLMLLLPPARPPYAHRPSTFTISLGAAVAALTPVNAFTDI